MRNYWRAMASMRGCAARNSLMPGCLPAPDRKNVLMRKRLMRIAVSWLAAGFIRLVWASSRWRTIDGEIPAAFWDAHRPFIVAFWHGRLMMAPYGWRRDREIDILISQHGDGDVIAHTIGLFGIGSVRGSSAKSGKQNKGGAGALRAMLRRLARGGYVGVTPDGPRGPRMRVDAGIISLARLSGAPVLAATYAASRRIHATSWDRFLIALPFSRGVFVWAEPLYVARDADAHTMEQARQLLEDTLNRITAEADAICGHPPIPPAQIAS